MFASSQQHGHEISLSTVFSKSLVIREGAIAKAEVDKAPQWSEEPHHAGLPRTDLQSRADEFLSLFLAEYVCFLR